VKKTIKDTLRLFWWSLSINWRAGPIAFISTSLFKILDTSVIGILNIFLASRLTASVAELALGRVSLKAPIFYVVAIAVVNIIIIGISRIVDQYTAKLSFNTEIVFAQMLFEAIGNLDQEQIDDEAVQSKITVAEREFWAMRELTTSLISMISVVFGYITALIVLSRFSLVITGALLLLTPLLIWISVVKNRYEKKNWDDTTNLWRLRYSSRYSLFDTFNFFEYILLGSRQRLREFWQSVQNAINVQELKLSRKIATLDLIENSMRELVSLASKLWAIVLVSNGKLAFDQFLFTIGLIEQAVTATWRVSYDFRRLHEGIIAGQAGLELLELKPLRTVGSRQLSAGSGLGIRLKDVSFAYPSSKVILKGINIEITAGEHIAIVGENGAGKSTLLKLMLAQYAPTTGMVLLDSEQADEYDKKKIYESFSVLVQNYSLFNYMTVRENIQAVNPKALSEKEIWECLELADVSAAIRKLPHGLNTRLDPTFDDGSELSGGQRQRLAIARSFAKNARLLVLDEPTSSIDAKAEKMIFDTIFERHTKSTVIIVSHRFSTVKKADRIIVIGDGKIIEQGSHIELMAQKGHYAELYNLQAQEYKD